jgi:formylglycine-generating enzyme required for sulfatase activity
MDAAELSRSHTRHSDAADERRPDLGFRCAADLAAAEPGAIP